MSKRVLANTADRRGAWTQRARAYWPLVPLTAMGMVTLVAVSHQSTRADGPTWTLPYQGTYTSGGADLFVNNTGTGTAVQGQSNNGTGLAGVSSAGSGVYGTSSNGYGVQGTSSYIGMLGGSSYIGVLGNTSGSGFGVVGQGNASGVGVIGSTQAANRSAVEGYNTSVYGSGGSGVYGSGDVGVVAAGASTGVSASGNNFGVYATGNYFGLYGICPSTYVPGYGVYGQGNQYGVYGISKGHIGGHNGNRAGVYGESSEVDNTNSQAGVYGRSSVGVGVRGDGTAVNTIGVYGTGPYGVAGTGVQGVGANGVYGAGNGTAGATYGIYGDTTAPDGNFAGYFHGNVKVTGTLTAASKNFKIDHPLDPANKYLVHSCVESSEMLNTYSGNVILDSDGKAAVDMPQWFQAENKDFRYQLTCVGGFAPVYVEKEMQDNRFEVAGGKAGQKISWQVTGVRQDAYARAHPMQVEETKIGKEKGKYLDPVEAGQPKTLGIDYENTQRSAQRLHSAPVMKAPAPPNLPKMAVIPSAFKPIRVPVALSLPDAPKSPAARP